MESHSILSHLLLEADRLGTFWVTGFMILCVALKPLLPEQERRRVRPLFVVLIVHWLLLVVAAMAARSAALEPLVSLSAEETVSEPAAKALTTVPSSKQAPATKIAGKAAEKISSASQDPKPRLARLAAFFFATLGYVYAGSLIIFSLFLARFQMFVPIVVRDILGIFVTIIFVLFASARFGFNLTGVFAASAVGGTALVLALREPFSNLMGTITLNLDKSIRVGDWITYDGKMGRVAEIKWRYTALETNDWETIIVPNTQLLNSRVIVHGRRSDQARSLVRRWIYFYVDFRYPVAEVMDIVSQALSSEPIPGVARHPEAHCLLMGVEESTARFAARYWLEDMTHEDLTDSRVRARLLYALKRQGIDVAIPVQHVVFSQQSEAEAQQAVADLAAREKALAKMELFRHFSGEERSLMARRLRRAPFVDGELLTRQGDEAHWLYLIEKGVVAVRVSADGVEREVAQLKAGDHFGEMGLMTGERRSATVVAIGAVDCFRLDKDAFEELIKGRPEVAENLASELAKRRMGLEAARQGLDDEARRLREAETKSKLLASIRHFFGIS